METESITVCDLCGLKDIDKYKFIYQSCWKCRKAIDVCLPCTEVRPLYCKECKDAMKGVAK